MVMSVRKADSPGAAVLLTVLGIVMGIVFTSNALFLITDVERSECAAVETRLLSNSRKQNTSSRTRIRLDCADGQRYFINASCATEALWESLCDLEPQTRINRLIHPHSRQTVVELDAGGSVLLSFDDSMRKLEKEGQGFLLLSALMYGCAVPGICLLIRYGIRRSNVR